MADSKHQGFSLANKTANFFRSDFGVIISGIATIGPAIVLALELLSPKLTNYDGWRMSLSQHWWQHFPALICCLIVGISVVLWGVHKYLISGAAPWRSALNYLAAPSVAAMFILWPYIQFQKAAHSTSQKLTESPNPANQPPELEAASGEYRKTISYNVDFRTSGTTQVWLLNCQGGPMDGRTHPIATDPARLIELGIRKAWVSDPAPYEQREIDRMPGVITINRDRDELSVSVRCCCLYEIMIDKNGSYFLGFVGQVDSDQIRELLRRPQSSREAEEVERVILLTGPGDSKISHKVYFSTLFYTRSPPGRFSDFGLRLFSSESPQELLKAGVTDFLFWDFNPFPIVDLQENEAATGKFIGQLLLVNISNAESCELRGVIPRTDVLETTK